MAFRDDDAVAREYSPPAAKYVSRATDCLSARAESPRCKRTRPKRRYRLASTIWRSSFFNSAISSRSLAATSNWSSAAAACIWLVRS
jgi:hypothetical protein